MAAAGVRARECAESVLTACSRRRQTPPPPLLSSATLLLLPLRGPLWAARMRPRPPAAVRRPPPYERARARARVRLRPWPSRQSRARWGTDLGLRSPSSSPFTPVCAVQRPTTCLAPSRAASVAPARATRPRPRPRPRARARGKKTCAELASFRKIPSRQRPLPTLCATVSAKAPRGRVRERATKCRSADRSRGSGHGAPSPRPQSTGQRPRKGPDCTG